MSLKRPVALAVLLIVAPLVPVAPVAGEDATDDVVLHEITDTWIDVETSRYRALIHWPDPGALVPTDSPMIANVTMSDGRELRVQHHLTWSTPTRNGQVLSEALLEHQPGVHRVKVDHVSLGSVSADNVSLHIRYAFYGATDAPPVRGIMEFVFREDRIEHRYGFHYPAFVVPSVRNNVSMTFSEPFDLHLSVDPNGFPRADDGESLDPYATWEAFKPYGILFKDDDSPYAFDYHRVFTKRYTNYLMTGRIRAADDGVHQVTFGTDGQFTTMQGIGVEATDFWNFPPASVTPLQLGAFYTALTGLGGGNTEPRPASEASVWPLRCPQFPARPGGGDCERVVVAVIDTGVNPYHAWYRRPGWTAHPSTYIDAFPADAPALPLTFGGEMGLNRLADLPVLAGLERGRLYTFPGTSIIGAISFGENYNGGVPLLDDGGHGTGTSSAVTAMSPDALLVVVETGTGVGEMDAAMDWVAAQPWIDIVTVSWGTLGNIGPFARPADLSQSHPELRTKAMWDAGKLVFTAVGNDGTMSVTDHYDGAPWVISVGGADRAPDNRSYPTTARLFDIVADHSQILPRHDDVYNDVYWLGTSFSSPQAAGAAAEGLLQARIALGHAGGITEGALVLGGAPGPLADGRLDNGEFRDALNATAEYLTMDGVVVPEDDGGNGTVLPVAPWLEQGWGHVDDAIVPALVDVLTGVAPAPVKPAPAVLQQATYQAAREAFWVQAYPVWDPVMQPLPGT